MNKRKLLNSKWKKICTICLTILIGIFILLIICQHNMQQIEEDFNDSGDYIENVAEKYNLIKISSELYKINSEEKSLSFTEKLGNGKFCISTKEEMPNLLEENWHNINAGNEYSLSDSELDTLTSDAGEDKVYIYYLAEIVSTFSGFNSLADFYLITTADDLAEFANLVNSGTDFSGKTVYLMANISVNGDFTTIGNSDKPFAGTFDGNGYTISSLNIVSTDNNIGLFACNMGTIKNLVIKGTGITGNSYVGGIVGRNEGTITNCINEVPITATNTYVGGMCGISAGGSIEYCQNNAAIVGTNGYAGGIIGVGSSSNDSTILKVYNCYNNGTVTQISGNSTGGIIGCVWSGISLNMSYCINNAKISATGGGYAGGLIGCLRCSNTDCANQETCSYSGAFIKYCRNYGEITAKNNYVGGIAGVAEGCAIDYTINTGKVTSTAGSCVGGIVGANNSNSKFHNIRIRYSVNTGAIQCYFRYVGGILGYSFGKANSSSNCVVVKCCANRAKVIGGLEGSSDAQCTAGIVGYAANTSVTYCYNTGNLEGYRYVAGIVNFSAYKLAQDENYFLVARCLASGTYTAKHSGSMSAIATFVQFKKMSAGRNMHLNTDYYTYKRYYDGDQKSKLKNNENDKSYYSSYFYDITTKYTEKLNWERQPSLYINPFNYIRPVGEQVTLKGDTYGANAQTYQWYVSDEEDGEYTAISDATLITYTATVENTGKWYYMTSTGKNSTDKTDVVVTSAKAYVGPGEEKTPTVIASVKMNDYTYGGIISEPSIEGNEGNGKVTYYYNETDSSYGGIEWNTVKSSTDLQVGTYYMYAIIDATENYSSSRTATVEFNVKKATPVITLDLESQVLEFNSTGTIKATVNSEIDIEGMLKISSSSPDNVTILSNETINLTSTVDGAETKITCKGTGATDNSTSITIEFIPVDTTNINTVTAMHIVTKVNQIENTLNILGRALEYTGEPQVLATVKNAQGTVYYSTTVELTSSNYTTGSQNIPTGTSAGTYTIYYYALGNINYKSTSGSVTSTISKEVPMLTTREYTASTDTRYAIGSYARLGVETYTSDLIKTITITNSKTLPSTFEATWDASYNEDGSVIGWVVKNGNMYDFYIGAELGTDKKIKVPANCASLFGNYTNCTQINGLELLDTSDAVNMYAMFDSCYNLTYINLSNFDTSNVTTMEGMFYNCYDLKNLDLSSFDTSNVASMANMFSGCNSLVSLKQNFDTSKVTTMNSLFNKCNSLVNLDLSGFTTSEVTNMNRMFRECTNLKKLNISSFDTSKVKDMYAMFYNCNSLENLNLTSFNDTSKVENMMWMFGYCQKLKNLNFEKFDTTNVTDMSYMFCGCSQLSALDLSTFNTENVTNMEGLFFNCNELLSLKFGQKFNQITGEKIFYGCSKLTAIITLREEILTLNDNATTNTYLKTLTNIILYVPNKTAESTFEKNTNYLDILGTDRIRPILELIGESKLSVGYNKTYADGGVTVAGMTKNADETYTSYGYTVIGPTITRNGTLTENIDTTSAGTYLLTYTLKDSKNNKGMDVTREVEVKGKPELMSRANYGDASYVIGYNREGSSTKYKSDMIKTIILKNNMVLPQTYEAIWDVSKNNDGSIMAWTVKNGDMYDLYIGANSEKILAPENSKELFSYYTNCTEILNLNLIDTSNVKNMSNMFKCCYNLAGLDVSNFDTKNVTNMEYIFCDCKNLTELDLSEFDTSKVENMIGMFLNCYSLENEMGLLNFDTQEVKTMREMFCNCKKLTKLNVSNFKTGKVTDMSSMFNGCVSLESLDVSAFLTTNVEQMEFLFRNCKKLTELDISNFNTTNVNNMSSMFYECQNLKNIIFGENFDISNVTDLSYMFAECNEIKELDLSNFNTSNVTDMQYMFNSCSNLSSLLLGSNFNKINDTEMFTGCTNLTSIITTRTSPMDLGTDTGVEALTVLYVPTLESETAFESATSYLEVFDENGIQPILELVGESMVSVAIGETYQDAGVTVAGMEKNENEETYTPYGYTVSEPVIEKDGSTVSNIDTSSTGTYTLTYTIYDSSNTQGMNVTRTVTIKESVYFESYLMQRETQSPTAGETSYRNDYMIGAERAGLEQYTSDLVSSITLHDTINIPTDAPSWDVSYASNGTVMAWLVSDGNGKYELNIGAEGNIYAINCHRLFAEYKNCTEINNLDILDTSEVEDMHGMFYGLQKVSDLGVSSFDTSNVTDMSEMFGDCIGLTEITVSGFDTSKVTNIGYMFYYCKSLENLDVSGFDTSSITRMEGMFNHCEKLTSLDVSNFDTSSVINMGYMFYYCSDLTNLNIENLSTNACSSMSNMFTNCKSLTSLDVSGFKTIRTTNMSGMFEGCVGLKNIDVTNFRTVNVTDMSSMFKNCSALTSLDVSEFNTSRVTNFASMFSGCSGLTSIMLENFTTAKANSLETMFDSCSNLETLVLGKNFSKIDGTNMFRNCTSLKRIIAKSENAMALSADTGIDALTNAKIYVEKKENLSKYTSATNYGTLYEAGKVRAMLEIIGDNPASVTYGATYEDEGATVAGWTENESYEYEKLGYTLTTTGLPVNTNQVGKHYVIYTLKYSNNIVDTVTD